MAITRLIVFTSYLIAVVPLVNAEDSFLCGKNPSLSSKASSEWMSRTQNKYKSLKALSAHFKQISYLKSLDIEEESSGEMHFSNPGKLRWEYLQPEKQVFVVHDEVFELYQPLDRQLIKQDLKSYFRSDVPIAFLLGIGNLEQSFRVISGCKNKNSIILTMIPKVGHDSTTEKIVIEISSSNSLPRSLRVVDHEQNITTFHLSDRQQLGSLSSDLFMLKVPDGTDIQDLRESRS